MTLHESSIIQFCVLNIAYLFYIRILILIVLKKGEVSSVNFNFEMKILDNMVKSQPRSSDPTCRSDRKRSDPCRISSESDIFHKKTIGSDTVFVGFLSIGIRSGFHRNSTEHDEIRPDPTRISSDSVEFRWNSDRIPIERNPTKTVSDPIEIFRSDRIRSPLYDLG